jgi:hypothetical protein
VIRWNEHFYAVISMAYTVNLAIYVLSLIPKYAKLGLTAGGRVAATIGTV